MGKLHELLASEADTEGIFKSEINQVATLFKKRTDAFYGYERRLEMFDESRKIEEETAQESKELIFTVPEKLDELRIHCVRYFDLAFQKEAMNQIARADLIVNEGDPTKERIIARDVPVTFLLFLERRLVVVRNAYQAIPTLEAGASWQRDESKKPGIWRIQRDEVKEKTEKVPKSKILYEATKEHPAQIEKWFEDRIIGRFTRRIWSGMLTERRKEELLNRFNILLDAVKRARARANDIDVDPGKIGDSIFDFLNE